MNETTDGCETTSQRCVTLTVQLKSHRVTFQMSRLQLNCWDDNVPGVSVRPWGRGGVASDRLQVDSLCGGTEGGSGGVLSELLLPPDI